MSYLLLNDATTPLFAQGGGQDYPFSWAVVIFCVFLGLSVTLNPSRRTTEIKRSKHE
jgi:hypothetical protein